MMSNSSGLLPMTPDDFERRRQSIMEMPSRHSARSAAIGESAAWRDVLKQAMQVAVTHTTVLLHGESGTGKEVVARLIHQHSPAHLGPFVAINCAALPETLLESETVWLRTGAFTGAPDKPGS